MCGRLLVNAIASRSAEKRAIVAANLFEGRMELDVLGAIGIGNDHGHVRFRKKMIVHEELIHCGRNHNFHIL